MNVSFEFVSLLVVSFCVFLLIIRIVIGLAEWKGRLRKILGLGLVVIVGGMLLGRFGAQWSLPWWIYYPIPMLLTVCLPPGALRMRREKTALYILLSFLSAPVIHGFFFLFLGWTNYMPFIKMPSIW